ncbi:MAG: hypothetical protein LWW79_13365 [Holophagaceae bacterium]|nr:hypothetical protein [Holophagaceae bacterium]
MDYTLQFTDGVFVVKTSGLAELPIFLAFIDALLAHPAWGPGARLLVDHRALDVSPFTFGAVQELADQCARRAQAIGPARIALLVADDLGYGMNRMWAALVQGRLDFTGSIFKSQEEALAWLTEGAPSQG